MLESQGCQMIRELKIVRFGVFEVDLGAGELRKGGIRIKLQDQPFQIYPCCWGGLARS